MQFINTNSTFLAEGSNEPFWYKQQNKENISYHVHKIMYTCRLLFFTGLLKIFNMIRPDTCMIYPSNILQLTELTSYSTSPQILSNYTPQCHEKPPLWTVYRIDYGIKYFVPKKPAARMNTNATTSCRYNPRIVQGSRVIMIVCV